MQPEETHFRASQHSIVGGGSGGAVIGTRLPWDLEPVLEVWVRPGDGEVTVVAAGRLDATTAGRLVRTVEYAGSDAPALVLDLTEVEQAFPSGWDVVKEQLAQLRSKGVPVGVVGGPDS